MDVLRDILRKNPDIHAVNGAGNSIIHRIVKHQSCDKEAIKRLLRMGASVNTVNSFMQTPLHSAVQNKSCPLDVINLLLGKVADVNAMDSNRLTVLYYAVYYSRKDVVQTLLAHPGVKVNVSDKHRFSLLHRALCVSECDPGIVKQLLDAGANIHKKNCYDQQPLHLAAYKCKPAVIKLLVNYGARVNVLDRDHRSPLYFAVKFRNDCQKRIVLKLLLDAGALIYCDHPMNKIFPIGQSPHEALTPLHDAIDIHRNKRCNCPCSLQYVKLLLKYALLERPGLSLEEFRIDSQTSATLSCLRKECLQEMQSKCIGSNITLAQFILHLRLKEDVECHIDQILQVLAPDTYPVYREVIMGLLSRQHFKDKLEKQVVYTVRRTHNLRSSIKKQVILNYDSLCILMPYLSDNELLNLVLAFHNAQKHVTLNFNSNETKGDLYGAIENEYKRFFKRARIN